MANFNVGDKAVYPGHGVGTIKSIEAKEIMGSKHEFYNIEIMDSGTKIMVPKKNAEAVGLRPVISSQQADEVIKVLKVKSIKIDNQTWNRRYREYMEKIKTGSVLEIAEVLRDLFVLRVDKELSFGERKMLDTARSLLVNELVLAKTKESLQEETEIKEIFGL